MAIMSGALILSGHSWFLFGPETRNTVAWAAYAASLLLFGLGVWLAEDTSTQLREGQSWNGSVPESPPYSRLDLWLIAIFLLALFMRLFEFSPLPFGLSITHMSTTVGECGKLISNPEQVGGK
jgi:hypothetical protein